MAPVLLVDFPLQVETGNVKVINRSRVQSRWNVHGMDRISAQVRIFPLTESFIIYPSDPVVCCSLLFLLLLLLLLSSSLRMVDSVGDEIDNGN